MPTALQHPELNPKIGYWSAAQKHEKYFKSSWKRLELKFSARKREKRSREPCLTNPDDPKSGRFPWVRPALVSPDCWHHLVASEKILFIEKQRALQASLAEQGCPAISSSAGMEKVPREWINQNQSKLHSGAQSMIVRNYQSKQLALISFLSKTVTLHLHPNSWQYHSWADFQDFSFNWYFTEYHWHLYSCKFQRTLKAIIIRHH